MVARREGGARGLDADPFRQFDRWFQEALTTEGADANAMSVSTVDADGQPSVRMVLLKYYVADGLVFYTHLGSRKAAEIAGNDRVALLVYALTR